MIVTPIIKITRLMMVTAGLLLRMITDTSGKHILWRLTAVVSCIRTQNLIFT